MLQPDLGGKVALITGATGGLGRQFAVTLAAHGARVIVTGRRERELLALAAAIDGKAIVADLCTVDIVGLIEQAEGFFGQPVSILINNAGVGHNNRALDCTSAVWRGVLNINLTVPFVLTQEVARRLIAAQLPGSVINVCSIFGWRPAKAMIAYATAKAGLEQMMRCFALELGSHGIRVNALVPGWHVTPMTEGYLLSERGQSIIRDIPLGRFGEPADLAGALLLLVSEAGRYISGATLVVDGGLGVGMRDGGIIK